MNLLDIPPPPQPWCYKSCWNLHAITNHLVVPDAPFLHPQFCQPESYSLLFLRHAVSPVHRASSTAVYSSALCSTNHFIPVICRGASPRTVQTRVIPTPAPESILSHESTLYLDEPQNALLYCHFDVLITFPLKMEATVLTETMD